MNYKDFWKYHNKDNMDKHAVELIESQAGRIQDLENIVEFAYDIHTKDPINIRDRWGVSGVSAEEKLCKMIEALKGE